MRIEITCPSCGEKVMVEIQLEKRYNHYIIKEFYYICDCCSFFYQYGNVINKNTMSWGKADYYSEVIKAIKDRLRLLDYDVLY